MATCQAEVQACALRVTRLEGNGVPDPGANNMYVTDAFTSLGVTSVVAEGDEFELKNACGGICINVKDCDRLKRLDLTLGLCRPDPELLELLAGGVVLTDENPGEDAIGYGYPALGQTACPTGVSVEIWTKRYDTGGAQDPTFPYNWWTFPRTYWQHGAKTFENGPITHELNGFAVENENWFNGPSNDWPVASDRVAQYIPFNTLPTVTCGYLSVAVS